MKNTLAILAATTALAFAPSAFAKDASVKVEENVDYKSNGGYEAEHKASQTLVDGTKATVKKTADVEVNKDGSVDKEVKVEATQDPKGLLNKKKEVVKTTVEHDHDGGYEKKNVNKATDAAGTDVKTETKTEVEVDSKGNVTKNVETTKVSDPKGLMNKTKTTTETKTENGVVVEQNKK